MAHYLDKKCACKGIRKCLKCDAGVEEECRSDFIIFCRHCGDRAYHPSVYEVHMNRHLSCDSGDFPEGATVDGIFLQTDVITETEERDLVAQIDRFVWIDSQSGRRKQDFGPKINFKKQKINFDTFGGLPLLDIQLLNRIHHERLGMVPDCGRFAPFPGSGQSDGTILNHFRPVEVAHLEYCPERGSSIDPHFDDFWIWGERLVTLNLLSDTVVTLTFPSPNNQTESTPPTAEIRIPVPRRAMLVLYGDARNRMHHSIRRSDIHARRISVTIRELPLEFLNAHTDTDVAKIRDEFFHRSQNLISPDV